DFSLGQSNVDLRAAVAYDHPGFFQAQQECEHATANEDRMAYCLRADSEPRGGSQFVEAVEAGLLAANEYVRIAAFRRTEINKLVDSVLRSGYAQDRTRDS